MASIDTDFKMADENGAELIVQHEEPPVETEFFDLGRQKKDSTVSLSENNSPRVAATVAEKPLAFDET